MSDANSMSFHVGFLCKLCSLIFKSVEEYLSHKAEFHFNFQLPKSRPSCIVFEESILEPTEGDLTNFWKAVVPVPAPAPFPVPTETQEIISNILKNKTPIGVKQESPEHSFTSEAVNSSSNNDPVSLSKLTYYDDGEPTTTNSEIKTEWVEENTVTLIKYDTPQQQQKQENDYLVPSCHTVNCENKSQRNYEKNNYYYDNDNDNQSSFISFDADVDQLENFDVTNCQPTTTFTSAETELEYGINENTRDDDSDGDEDVICLDDPLPLPPPPPTSAANKLAASKIVPPPAASTSASTVTTTRLNSLILSQLKLECQICFKKFESSAQLRIHVTICQLYNGKTKKSGGQPQGVRSRSRGNSRAKVMGSGLNGSRSFVKCDECSKGMRPSQLASHLRTQHNILVQDSERKYVCNICDSAFRNSTYLKGHLMVHSNARPFMCSVHGCNRSFKYERNVRQHTKTAHPHLD